MTGGQPVNATLGIAGRQVTRMRRSPPLWLPALIFPLGLFAAFAGGLSALGARPTFGYPSYTTFQFVYALMQASVVGGVAVGISLAGDFESGFARRMFLSTRGHAPILGGYVLSGLLRAVVLTAVLFAVGLLVGMKVSGSVVQVAGVIALALLLNLVGALFALGVATRLRSVQAAPAMQVPILVLMFLVPVYTPRRLLSGWVHSVANVNPITPILESARGLIVGEPVSVALAFAVSGGLLALLGLWALTGMRRAALAGGRA